MSINVMVSIYGMNEDDNAISALHTFTVETEAEVNEWVAKAPAISRNIDDGPPIRVQIPGRNKRRLE